MLVCIVEGISGDEKVDDDAEDEAEEEEDVGVAMVESGREIWEYDRRCPGRPAESVGRAADGEVGVAGVE